MHRLQFNCMMGISFYVMLALLFCTARRRNGFAAVHDLVTKTRVISRTALEWRPILSAVETPSPAVDGQPTVGPYQVLETLETNAEGQWLLGYDLRLLRKVWIHTVPPDTPPVPALLRNIGRVGRLRWLTGRRTPEENWDAFEGASGQPLLRLIQDRQPWSRVRFWLYDLAREIGAAEKDGTLPPVLELDRVWITGDGRAKLLDFPAPGLAMASPKQAVAAPAASPLPETERIQCFLGEVAVAALEGRTDAAANTAAEATVPLPLHAHDFLKNLPQLSHADSVAVRAPAAAAARDLDLAVAARGRGRRVCHRTRAGECYHDRHHKFGLPKLSGHYGASVAFAGATIHCPERTSEGRRQHAQSKQENRYRPPDRRLHRQPLPGNHHQRRHLERPGCDCR